MFKHSAIKERKPIVSAVLDDKIETITLVLISGARIEVVSVHYFQSVSHTNFIKVYMSKPFWRKFEI